MQNDRIAEFSTRVKKEFTVLKKYFFFQKYENVIA